MPPVADERGRRGTAALSWRMDRGCERPGGYPRGQRRLSLADSAAGMEEIAGLSETRLLRVTDRMLILR